MDRPQYVPISSNGSPSRPASAAAAYRASPSSSGMNPFAASNAASTAASGPFTMGSASPRVTEVSTGAMLP